MNLKNLKNELLNTLNTYKSIYESSLANADKHLKTLNQEDKQKYGKLISDIKKASAENDTNKLRSLLYELKNKN